MVPGGWSLVLLLNWEHIEDGVGREGQVEANHLVLDTRYVHVHLRERDYNFAEEQYF